ncbi:MAG: hypothetical protein BWY89_02030 [Bacteroidetes bacterium ADurb.BinA012]|nr:MAG: hypothetical protein BWY89_02030 [Bacteroidetes bacterium ADurb.BinA012]
MVSEYLPAGLTKSAHPVSPLTSASQYIAAKTRKLMPLQIIPQLGVARSLEMINHFRKKNPRAREIMPITISIKMIFSSPDFFSFLISIPANMPVRTISGTLPCMSIPRTGLTGSRNPSTPDWSRILIIRKKMTAAMVHATESRNAT